MSVTLLPRPVLTEAHTRILDVDGVAVHWHYRRGPGQPAYRYHCEDCGHAEAANECAHVFAAALHLARALLGLEPAGAP